MRVALLSDVHANSHALRAVLQDVRSSEPDVVACAGDVVGYGPHPNECVELLGEEGAVCVAGNHDLIVCGALSTDRCSPLARRSLEWTQERLRPDVLRWLGALPLQQQVGGLLMAHGSPGDSQEYVRRETRARELARRVGDLAPGADLLVLGHTHLPWLLSATEGSLLRGPGRAALAEGVPHLLNPGSVGQPRNDSPDATWALVDTAARTADIRAVPYDVAACERALRSVGLPTRSCRPAGRFRRLAHHLVGR